MSDDEPEQGQFVSRATLVSIIKPRVEEILEMVRDRLAASSFASDQRSHVIITGGACQLTGLPDLAARILGRPVRIGRPLGIAGFRKRPRARLSPSRQDSWFIRKRRISNISNRGEAAAA